MAERQEGVRAAVHQSEPAAPADDAGEVDAKAAKIWLRSLAPYAAVLEAAGRVIDDDAATDDDE